jgi:hypothetical protein
MDFDTFEYTIDCVRVFAGEPLGFFEGIGLNNNKTPGFISEWACEYDPSCLVERFHVGQVSRTMNLSFSLPLGTIEADDDEFHRSQTIKIRLSLLTDNGLCIRWSFHATI